MKSRKTRFIILVIFILLSQMSVHLYAAEKPLATITVEAGKYDRIDTPVSVSLEAIAKDLKGAPIGLIELKDSEQLPVASQIEQGNPAKLWWILNGSTPAGSKRTYQVVPGLSIDAVVIEAVRDDKVLVIKKEDHKVLQYNHAIVPAPQGQSSLYDRSGFIHPLWSPTGAVLTNIHPRDHTHHFGIWMPWTHTRFEGRDVDFWNVGSGQGTVRFVKFLSTTTGPVYGGFQAEHEHIAFQTEQGEKVVLREVWDVRVYNVGGPTEGYWLVDFMSTQWCAADSPLQQIEYRYGGFGFRGAAEWDGPNVSYLTSEGRDRNNGHATRARWCDTAGAINGVWAGVTHLSHPQNFRHPEPMRIWPEKENPQVFFNWAPSQAGDWVMGPGKDYIFRYRLYVHEGKVNVDNAERFWHDFAEPPEVKLQKTQ